jgi:hypothetical protein
MEANVRRDGHRAWIEGARGWSSASRCSSVHAAQEAVMQAAGEDTSYAHLVGVSGLAFRMQVSRANLCPSSPHALCGHRCVAGSLRALPWEARIFEVKPDDTAGVREARSAIAASIDRGVPAQYGSEEDGIIVGYLQDGEAWICYHPLHDAGRATFVETAWPWGIAVYTARKRTRPARRELAAGALQQAIAMAEAREAGDYHVGFAAWDAYGDHLRRLDDADDATRQQAVLGNAWIYTCLVQYRACAAAYLRDVAVEFDQAAARHLDHAARLYEQMSGGVLTDGAHDTASIAPYPWMVSAAEPWSAALRRQQIERLERAQRLEREALAAIELALAATG